MESLIKALLEMKELVKKQSFTPSVQPTQLPTLPSIKLPKASPLTPPSPTAPKIPGIAAASGKDPKKMAEQLKNPTERKAKIEMLKFETNGQWSLKKWDEEQKAKAIKWANSGDRTHLDTLPPVQGPKRQPMLDALKGRTQHRVNNGTTEYLLHRTHAKGSDFHNSNRTSWTADPEFANYWKNIVQSDSKEPQEVSSKWIPEHKIHSYMSHMLENHPDSEKDEDEVILHPLADKV